MRLRPFLREVRRRKVLRTLAIYSAIGWGAIAAAPDLLDYLILPPWSFSALIIGIALGLPIVLVGSWYFEILFEGATTPVAQAAPLDELGAERSGQVEPESGAGTSHQIAWTRWVIGAAAALFFIFLGARQLARRSTGDGPVRVVIYRTLSTDQVEGRVSAPEQVIRQSLEWLVEAEVVSLERPSRRSSREELREARGARADYYLVTEVTAIGEASTLSVILYSAMTGEAIFRATGGGVTEPVAEAAGRISVRVAQALATFEGVTLKVRPEVAGATSSPVALAHYLDARLSFAARDFDGAVGSLRRALQADSTFIPAYYRLAVVERWRWDYETGLVAIEAGLRRTGIAPRWQRLLEAQRSYLMRNVEEAVRAFEDVTLHYPELLDGWLGLGEALFHYGSFAGHQPSDARAPLERALKGDSLVAPVRSHLAELAFLRGEHLAASRLINAMDSQDPQRHLLDLAIDLRFGNNTRRGEVIASLDQLDLRTISLLAGLFSLDPSQPETVRTIAAELLSPGRAPEDRLRGVQYLLTAARDEEEWAASISLWREIGGGADFDPWVVQAHQAGRDISEALPMLAWANEEMMAGRLPDFETPFNHDSRRAFHALVHDAVLNGDSTRVSVLLDRIASSPPMERTDPSAEVLSAALRSRTALLAGDTLLAIDELSSAVSRTFEPFVMFYPLATMGPERLLLVRLARAQDATVLAERWRKSFFTSTSFGDLIYRTWVSDVREDPRFR